MSLMRSVRLWQSSLACVQRWLGALPLSSHGLWPALSGTGPAALSAYVSGFARVAIPLLRIADMRVGARGCAMSIGVLESGLALLPRLESFGVHTALVCGLGVPADRLAVKRESVADASFCSLSSVRSFPAHSKCLKCRNAFRTSPRTLNA